MDRVYKYLLEELRLVDGDIIVAGISGGPDSMALLAVLKDIRKKLDIKIICAHVNHNIRVKESAKEKIFLENWCKNSDIIFESMIIEKYGDDNFHNEARNIRYHYFEEIIEKYGAKYLMTAHHGDDLIETILMRITRGSTLKGYSGFSEVVDMGNYKIVRPLITMTKKQIEDYDKKHKIPYATDKSNFKTKYTRNRYRKYVLPFLKSEDVNVHDKFLKFSKLLEDYDEFINLQVEKVFNNVYKDSILNIEKYNELEKLLQNKIIYKILEDVYQDDLMLINDKHVILIQDLINSNKKNSYIYLPNDVKIVRAYNEVRVNIGIDTLNEYEIELIDYAVLPNGKHIEMIEQTEENGNDICRLSAMDVKLPLHIRTRKHGDKIELKGTNGHKKVKDIFIDSKIPLEERELWPIVVDSEEKIVWIPGIKKSKFNKQKNEKCDIIVKYY